jgi:hypothetical protein
MGVGHGSGKRRTGVVGPLEGSIVRDTTPPTRLGRMAVVLLALGVLALAAAGGAEASTVSLDGGMLRFSSSPGEFDSAEISLRPRQNPTEVQVTRTEFPAGAGSPTPGPGCIYKTPPDPDPYATTHVTVRCALPVAGTLPQMLLSLRDGNDDVTVDERLHAVVYGGTGNDGIIASGDLYGGPGNDSVSAKGAGSRVSGGPGDDDIRAGPGADVINPGPGRDEIWLVNENRTKTAWKDTRRDSVRSRDGDRDDIYCDSTGPTDVLRVDGFDWPSDWATRNWPDDPGRPCKQLFRSSPPLPLPSAIHSPEYEISEGTEVWVFCPSDGQPVCRGTIMLKIAGRTFGPTPFRVRAGSQGEFQMTSAEYGWDENRSFQAFITLRVRDQRGRLVRIRDNTMSVGPSPYDDNG